jgi:hypothetical protein
MTERRPMIAETPHKQQGSKFPLLGKAAIAAATAMTLLGVHEAVAPDTARAAAYADSVSAPHYEGSTVSGSANINTNCDGTVGCWSYVKVEFRPDSPGVPSWLEKWRYLDGNWAVNGQNNITVPTQEGCGEYRTVVDSYNDFYGEQGSISIGLPGTQISLEMVGHGVDRLHLRSAASAYICKVA